MGETEYAVIYGAYQQDIDSDGILPFPRNRSQRE